MGEREDEGARICLEDAIIMTLPLSLSVSSNTISVVFEFKQRDRYSFLITTLMERLSSEAMHRSTVKHSCFEASTSEDLAQEYFVLSFGAS